MSLAKFILLHSMRLSLCLSQQLDGINFAQVSQLSAKKILFLSVVVDQVFSSMSGHFGFRISDSHVCR
jgi:hypothetical protein